MQTKSLQNRNDAYISIIEALPEKRQLIFQLVKENAPCTAWEISEKYMLPINEVVGRITELKDRCLIIEVGNKENRWTKRNNTTYRAVKNLNDRTNMINARYVQLIGKRDKLINDCHLGLSDLTKDLVSKEVKKIDTLIKSLAKISEETCYQ